MNLFAGTAAYYYRYRPRIPTEVAELLVAEANRRSPATTLLDLGTGTGQVVAALHRHFRDIIAVDPDPEMVERAEWTVRPVLSPGTGLCLYPSRAENFVPLPVGRRLW